MDTLYDALIQLCDFFQEYPFIPGTISFGITWLACSIAQEYLEYGKSLANADWPRAVRFCLFGALFMSPMYYLWLKITFPYFMEGNFMNAVARAVLEQVTVGPISLLCFFFIMCLLEMQPLEVCVNEVREKFWPTYITGCMYWPIVEIMNYYFVSENNRMVFVSVFYFLWVIFLAHKEAVRQKIVILAKSEV